MEEINKNNLDEWLFEYFEGNLGKEDSEKLFFEIGNNPSYQSEFKFWKQSYLTENSPLYYPFANKIKKRYFWERKWFYVLTAMAGVVLFYFYPVEQQETNNQATAKVYGKAMIDKEIVKENISVAQSTPLKKKTNYQNVKQIPKKEQKISVYSKPDSVVIITIPLAKDSVLTEVIKEHEKAEAEKQPVETNTINNNAETEKKTTVKKKTGTHLKLSEKITEMNSNF